MDHLGKWELDLVEILVQIVHVLKVLLHILLHEVTVKAHLGLYEEFRDLACFDYAILFKI